MTDDVRFREVRVEGIGARERGARPSEGGDVALQRRDEHSPQASWA